MDDIVERLRECAGKYDEYDWHSAVELDAAAEIERLRGDVARLTVGGVAYAACLLHRLHTYSLTMRAAVAVPVRVVCPICAGLAKNVSGPHLVA